MSFVFVFDRGKTLSGTQYKSTAALKSQSGLMCSVTLWVKHDNSDDTHQPKMCVCVCVCAGGRGQRGLEHKRGCEQKWGIQPRKRKTGTGSEARGRRSSAPVSSSHRRSVCSLLSQLSAGLFASDVFLLFKRLCRVYIHLVLCSINPSSFYLNTLAMTAS